VPSLGCPGPGIALYSGAIGNGIGNEEEDAEDAVKNSPTSAPCSMSQFAIEFAIKGKDEYEGAGGDESPYAEDAFRGLDGVPPLLPLPLAFIPILVLVLILIPQTQAPMSIFMRTPGRRHPRLIYRSLLTSLSPLPNPNRSHNRNSRRSK
jgi:hypothetical protein